MAKEIDDKHISKEGLAFWYQAILSRYTSANVANSSIDTKSGVVLAAAIALLIYLAQVTTQPLLVTILAAIGLIIVCLLGLRNIHTRDTSVETHTTEEMESYYYSDSDENFYWQMIADLEDSLKKINIINDTKAKIYKQMVYVLIASSVLVILAQYIKLTITFTWV